VRLLLQEMRSHIFDDEVEGTYLNRLSHEENALVCTEEMFDLLEIHLRDLEWMMQKLWCNKATYTR
jgi:hypothetical protein